MKVLDLFSGIGGFSLGLERAGMTTTAFCEIDPYCQKVLKKHWPSVPVFSDIKKLHCDDLEQKPELICGGYPCQPFSIAGKQRGAKDDRHLWPEMFRIIEECGPRWVIGENVAGHINLGLDKVLSDLEGAGYTCRPFVIPAVAVDAPHRRDRVWIVAHAHSHGQSVLPLYDWSVTLADSYAIRLQEKRTEQSAAGATRSRPQIPVGYAQYNGSFTEQMPGFLEADASRSEKGKEWTEQPPGTGGPGDNETLADPNRKPRSQECNSTRQPDKERQPGRSVIKDWRKEGWPTEPRLGRVAHGIPHRVDRLKSLGNSLVPKIPELIGRCIMEIENY